MELVCVTITCPITWWERCKWLEQNSSSYYDNTIWGLWQIGQGDIELYVSERDAVNYYLRWT